MVMVQTGSWLGLGQSSSKGVRTQRAVMNISGPCAQIPCHLLSAHSFPCGDQDNGRACQARRV